MEQTLEERIRGLAEPLWESAARPYGLALDFWLMAEKMVLEAMSLGARMTATALRTDAATEPSTPALCADDNPAPLPVQRVRELAYHMWESAGRQQGMATEFWLAAQKHVTAIMRAQQVSRANTMVLSCAQMTPEAYMDNLRHMAYEIWQSMGSPYGQAFECWLAAERRIFDNLSTSTVPADASAKDDAPAALPAPSEPAAPVAAAAPASEPEPAPAPAEPTTATPAAEPVAVPAAPVDHAAPVATAAPAEPTVKTEPATPTEPAATADPAPPAPRAAPAKPAATKTAAAPRARRTTTRTTAATKSAE